MLSDKMPFSNSVEVFSSKGIFYVEKNNITSNSGLINKWKVIISKTSSEHAGQSDSSGRKKVLSRIEILSPNVVCSESYLLVKASDEEQEVTNVGKYLKTKFVRFLLSTILLTQNIVKDKFSYVPMQDFTDKSDIDWSKSIPEIDQQLYKKYNLTAEEINFIESKIKPME